MKIFMQKKDDGLCGPISIMNYMSYRDLLTLDMNKKDLGQKLCRLLKTKITSGTTTKNILTFLAKRNFLGKTSYVNKIQNYKNFIKINLMIDRPLLICYMINSYEAHWAFAVVKDEKIWIFNHYNKTKDKFVKIKKVNKNTFIEKWIPKLTDYINLV